MSVDQGAGSIPAPGKEDTAVRSAAAGKTPRAPVTDPEAPHGWMIDPKTGERRPKKRPGRQKTGDRAVTPPRDRPTNAARDRAATAAEREKAEPKAPAGGIRQPIQETLEAAWMILAGVPTPEKPTKFLGIDIVSLSIRAKAQAHVLEQNSGKLIHAATLAAEHNKQARHAVEKFAGETGPAWVLPAMMAVLPFAVQSAQVWKVPTVGDLAEYARISEEKFDQLVKTMSETGEPVERNIGDVVTVTVVPGESANGSGPDPS